MPLLSRKSLQVRPCKNLSNQLALKSFFTPLTEKKASGNRIEWHIHDKTLIVGKYRFKDLKPTPSKIAAFDLVYRFLCGGVLRDRIVL